MNTREEALKYGLSFPGTYQDSPFHDDNWQLIRIKGSKKVFLGTYERNGYINLNDKLDPDSRDFYRNVYESVILGWHQNKEHWNTIILDGSVPDFDVKNMIAISYGLVTDKPSIRIYEAVKRIPKGKVATYGQVAELAGAFAFSGADTQQRLLEADEVFEKLFDICCLVYENGVWI